MKEKEREEFKKELMSLLLKYGFQHKEVKTIRIHLKPDFLITINN